MAWYSFAPSSPTVEPVTLSDAKAQLRVLDNDEDTLIESYVSAARAHVEAYTGQMLGARAVTAMCDNFADLTSLPFAPVSAVTSIAYVDTDGASQTVANTVYRLNADGLAPSITLQSGETWPGAKSGERITLTATAGGSLPVDVRHAMLLLIGQWFAVREAVELGASVSELPHAVADLLCNHRRFGF